MSEIIESLFLRVIPYFSINCIFLSIGVNLQAPLLTAKAASTKKKCPFSKIEQAFFYTKLKFGQIPIGHTVASIPAL